MEEIDDKILESISIPAGLEERLTSKIDLWAEAERKARAREAHPKERVWRRLAAAVIVIALIISASLIFKPTPKGRIDTYDDPKLAYLETVKVLSLLSKNLTVCDDKISEIENISIPTDSIINTMLSNLLSE